MNILEKLFTNRWFVKAINKDEYYQVKDGVGKYKEFLREKLGYHVIVNPYVIKLEKIPAKAENWMGISEFNNKMEYVFLCIVLMFLEDKEVEGQFILSQLTEYIQSVWKESEIDWTLYQNRRYLVKVLKFCVSSGMLMVYDGDEDSFRDNSEADVLYLNTGASRYFMRNFTQDIIGYVSPDEFEANDWIEMDEDRGIVRRHRAYRRLLVSMGFYRNEHTEEDYTYVKTYRNIIQSDFSNLFDCELQIYRNQVFLVLGESCNMGNSFPENNGLSDIVLMCSSIIREQVDSCKLVPNKEGELFVSKAYFMQILDECKKKYQNGFFATYRKMTTQEFCEEVFQYLIYREFIREDDNRIQIFPVVCRVVGKFSTNIGEKGDSDE